MKRRILVLAVIMGFASAAVILVIWNTDLFYSRCNAERDLRAARTAAEEYAAFDRIATNTRVIFALYDARGDQLGISTSDWPNRAYLIRFYQFGDPPLDHNIIERKNIFTLMRE